jgi:hypothetical protein
MDKPSSPRISAAIDIGTPPPVFAGGGARRTRRDRQRRCCGADDGSLGAECAAGLRSVP